MTAVLIGAVLLSALHAALPNHWITMVMLSRAERWTHRESLFVTAIAGFTHTISTIVVGIFIGLAGWKLSQVAEVYMRVAAPAILAGIGLFYVILDLSGKGSHRHCCHDEDEPDNQHHKGHLHPDKAKSRRGKAAVIGSLMLAMFLSPCLEIEAFYFTAAKFGWAGIISVSVIYVVLSIVGMVVLVHLGLKGVEKLRWSLLQHHERLVSGIMLILVSLLVYFVEF